MCHRIKQNDKGESRQEIVSLAQKLTISLIKTAHTNNEDMLQFCMTFLCCDKEIKPEQQFPLRLTRSEIDNKKYEFNEFRSM